MSIAFIIVTYQARVYLEGLFSTLAQFTDLSDARVIVVDNASTDGTLEELARVSAGWTNVEVLPQPNNTGFAQGNNIGIARARALGAEFVVLLNQDLELTPHWIEPLLAVMRERHEVAAAQPLILLHSDPERINTAGNCLHFCGFGYCGEYLRSTHEVTFDQTRSVAFASGAALLLRMKALDEAGDFDPMLFLYHEDCELQIRLRMLGYDCVVVPTARVMHKYTATFSARKYALLDRNRWLVLLKDWPIDRLLVAAPALCGTELAVLVHATMTGWLRQKVSTYAEIAHLLPEVLRARKRAQSLRSSASTDGDFLTGEMHFDGLDHPLITRFANPILSGYWAWARRVLKVR
ncbi:MAG TPA: glycosyltransferase family 2 protein [Polyangiaceae bacterium]|nr:glycosyltransferase family 2 protein [Polyangiaceae bacterium]